MKILKIKRGLEDNLPELEIGELAFTTDKKRLYVGSSDGNVLVNGGSGGSHSDYGTKFTGHTLPFTYKNASTDNRTFFANGNGWEITITGLEDYATFTGNGTDKVSYEITHNGDDDLAVDFVITLENAKDTFNYIGTFVYYGKEVDSGKCLVLAQKYSYHSGDVFDDNWIIIESASTPTSSTSGSFPSSWNGIQPHNIVGFNIGKNTSTTITNFLTSAYSFNQPINLPSVTHFSGFHSTYSFNQPINLPNLTNITGDTFWNCYTFNQPVNFPNLTTITCFFFRTVPAFNQPVNFPNLTNFIGMFYECFSFNQPIDFPELLTIAPAGEAVFLRNCYSFNSPINLPKVTTIGHKTNASYNSYFLNNCFRFNSTINIPSCKVMRNYFLSGARALKDLEWNIPYYPKGNNVLDYAGYDTGVRIWGENAEGFMAALPNTAGRNLILGSTYHDD